MTLSERLLAYINADFPELDVHSTRLATNGWDHDVLIANDEIVFRFPNEPGTLLDVEVAVLDRLRGKTTLPIPRIEYRGRSAHYVGYALLRGSELTRDVYASLSPAQRARIAHDLATFLHEVHSAIDVDTARTLGVRIDDPTSYLEESRDLLDRIDDPAIASFLLETFAEFEQLVLATPAPESFLYNDLHGDNTAFDVAAGRVNGIFDFGDIAIGDLHREFAPLHGLDRELFEATLQKYESLASVSLSRRRIVLIHRMDRISDLAFLFDQTDNPEVGRVFAELRDWMKAPFVYR